MTRAADFGPLIVETDIDRAVIAQLRLWLPDYLSAVEDERGLSAETLARPRAESFESTLLDEEFADHALPAILVTTATTDDDPEKDGNGRYYAGWSVVVSSIVRGATPAEVRWVAALFGGSVRRLLTQQQALGGLASEVVWRRANVAPVDDRSGAGRYLAAGINVFTVYVDGVLDESAGPAQPSQPPYETDPGGGPYEPLATVGEVTAQIDGMPVTEGS